MALITCPECQQQISDQATACPKCGFPLSGNAVADATTSNNVTLDANEEMNSVPTAPAVKPKNKVLMISIAAVACVALIALTVFLVNKNAEKQARLEYINNLNLFLSESFSGAVKAETVCGLTYKVWYDTIYEEYRSETVAYTKTNGEFNEDFNDSLYALYSSDEMISVIVNIEANQIVVDELFLALQNPSEEFATCFSVVEDLYSAYYNLTSLAVSPSGSLNTYSENYSDYDSAFVEHYDKLNLLVPEE